MFLPTGTRPSPLHKPRGMPRINWQYWLAERLFAAYLCWEGGGTRLGDATGKVPGALNTTIASWGRAQASHGGAPAIVSVSGGAGTQTVLTLPTLFTPWTIAFWFTTSGTASYGAIVDANGGNGIYTRISGSGYKCVYYNGADQPQSTVLTFNTWYHIAIVVSGGTTTFYVNGVAEAGITATSVNLLLDSMFNDRFGDSWQGTMESLMMWTKALTATDVWQLYTNPYAMVRPPPIEALFKGAAAAAVALTGAVNFTVSGTSGVANVVILAGTPVSGAWSVSGGTSHVYAWTFGGVSNISGFISTATTSSVARTYSVAGGGTLGIREVSTTLSATVSALNSSLTSAVQIHTGAVTVPSYYDGNVTLESQKARKVFPL